jgi:ATP-dependent helicase IRC3
LNNHIANGGRVLWLAHRRSLLRQAFTTFTRIANIAHPRKESLNLIAISSAFARWSNVTNEHEVIFSSMQTAVLESNAGFIAELKDNSPGGLFVVLDEAHHAPAPRSYELLKKMKGWGCPLLGLTATPVRADDDDEKRLSALFDRKVIYQVSRRELTDRDILATPSFETVKTNVNLEKDFTPEDYKHLERFGELGPSVLARLAKHAGRNQLIVEHYLKKRGTYGPTIVFAADTLHAQTLSGEFKKAGVDADYVDYSRDDAQDIILKYQEKKKPDVLVNVEMLTEGFDAPHTRTVFIARPTRSEGLLAQMVGRALRGKESGGNDTANLVTFLDTWEQFNVLDAEYVLSDPLDVPKGTPTATDVQRIPIPVELVREAYRLLQSNVGGQLVGVFQCLPYGWYAWEETFEDDLQRRSVMVFDNQHEQLAKLLAAFPKAESVPAEVTEDFARNLLRKYFADVPDPLPRWADIKALLDAKRKGCTIHNYTFEEKNEFEPRSIARTILDKNLPPLAQQKHIQDIWDSKPACRGVYRDDQRAFIDDVTREMNNIMSPPKPAAEPEVVKIVPNKEAPRPWPTGERGYSLTALREGVLSVKKHFPNGSPLVGELRWSNRVTTSLWGFCRYSDKSITLNCVLDSPDVPLFVVEFLMFHEMLHADMPSAGHNRDFRQRERSYAPSVEALEDATKRGIKPGPRAGADFWRVRADMFFDTFARYYAHKKPGAEMDL